MHDARIKNVKCISWVRVIELPYYNAQYYCKPLMFGGLGRGSFSKMARVASTSSLVSSFRLGLSKRAYQVKTKN